MLPPQSAWRVSRGGPPRVGSWRSPHFISTIRAGPSSRPLSVSTYFGRPGRAGDRVVPLLKGREVVTFDFLGWGQSSKPARYAYTFAAQEQDLNAVIESLRLSRVVLVAHDASVPAAINWTLDHPGRVASLILSNGFYAPVAGSGPPALAAIFALGQYSHEGPLGPLPSGTAYGLNSLMNGLSSDRRLLDDLLTWQESTFFANPAVARRFVPLFTHQFLTRPSTLRPLRSLTGNLLAAVTSDATRLPSLETLPVPVHLIWGAHDPNLDLNIAHALHQEIPHSTLIVLPNAHHNVMLDDPSRFASVITSAVPRATQSKNRHDEQPATHTTRDEASSGIRVHPMTATTSAERHYGEASPVAAGS
jgi:haloalkane dehalogenase